VIARAQSAGPRHRAADSRRLRFVAALALTASPFAAAPACAQISGSVSIESDYRYRGYSLSAGRPIARADLGYDDKSGVYLNGAAIAVLRADDRLALLGGQANIGYAARIGSRTTIDAGVMRAEYSSSGSARRPFHYTEAYVGLATRGIATRVSYSPDYFYAGRSTLYFEVEAVAHPAPNWSLSGHVGGLAYLGKTPLYSSSTNYDWRLGVARRLGAFDLHLSLTGGGPGRDYYRSGYRSKTAVVAGASFAF